VPVIGREKLCYKKVKGRRKNMPRGKLKHKKRAAKAVEKKAAYKKRKEI